MTVVWLIQGGLWVAWVWTEFRCDPPVSSETQAKGVLEEALITLGFRRAGKEPAHLMVLFMFRPLTFHWPTHVTWSSSVSVEWGSASWRNVNIC